MKKKIGVILLTILLTMCSCSAYADTSASACCSRGIAYIERMGIGFSLNEDTTLRKGDLLESKMDSQIDIHMDGASLALNENSVIQSIDPAEMSAELAEGELFAEIAEGHTLTLYINGKTIVAENSVLFVNTHIGSATVNVLSGSANADGIQLLEGEAISFSGDQAEKLSVSASAMNDFSLKQILSASDNLAVTHEQAEKVIAQREEEIRKAQEEQAAHDAAILAQGGTEKAQSKAQGETGKTESKSQGETEGAEPKVQDKSEEPAASLSCTIEIRCDTILDNMQNLTDGKNAFVPASGVILSRSAVAFNDGETVFDVLKRACSYAGIQLEYSWTPMYDSYYIEGINNLYEFDCGEQSGWMYKVNGWFPNYGCSSYTLKDGDTIVWCYTCIGLGADVGGSVY